MKSPRYYIAIIRRRGGIINAVRLQYVFWKIGRDKYVRISRKKYAKQRKQSNESI